MSVQYRPNFGQLSIDMSVKLPADTDSANVGTEWSVDISIDTLLADVETDAVGRILTDMSIDISTVDQAISVDT